MCKTEEHIKIRFLTDDEKVEKMWAKELGNDHYRIDNTPFFIYNLSWNDIVEARATDGGDNILEFIKIVKKSGHKTVRVILEEYDDKETFLKDICTIGCSYEGMNGKYFGIDIPPSIDILDIRDFLIRRKVQWEHADPSYSDLFSEDI